MSLSTEISFSQVDAYPWTAALLRDEDIQADYINSQCAAVIVSTSVFLNLFSRNVVVFAG